MTLLCCLVMHGGTFDILCDTALGGNLSCKSGHTNPAVTDHAWSLAHMLSRSSYSCVLQGRLPEETLWRVLWQLAQVS